MSLVELRWSEVKSPPPGQLGRRVSLLIIGHGEDEDGKRNQMEFGHITRFLNTVERPNRAQFNAVSFMPTMHRTLFPHLGPAEDDLSKRAVEFLKILGVKCVIPAYRSQLAHYDSPSLRKWPTTETPNK